MNIEYLREFTELAQCLNYTETAQKLNLTQPALSKHILYLEKEFGIDLLERDRKSVQLTEAGRILFENASVILDKFDETKGALRALKMEAPLRVAGHLDDSDIASLSSMIAMIARENYHVPIIFDRHFTTDPIKLVSECSVDLFVGYINPEKVRDEGLLCRPFVTNRLTAIVGTYHAFAKKEAITWSDLKNEILIKFISEKTNPAWDQIEEACLRHGFTPKTRAISSMNDVEFFSTPLQGSVLVWKKSQKQIGMLLETGHRASIPLMDDDAYLVAYALYSAENEERLQSFFRATEDAKELLDKRKDRKDSVTE